MCLKYLINVFLFFGIVQWTSIFAQNTEVITTDTSTFSIDNCLNEFDSTSRVIENSGWHYFFTDKAKQNGWSIKMSYVNPGTFRHGTHKHTGDEIVFVLEGSAEITIGNRTKIVGPNTSVYFPKGSVHGLKNSGDTTLKYLVIKKD